MIFQSTLPRRERPNTVYAIKSYQKFQSTLPRRERPPADPAPLVSMLKISIHAPAEGATLLPQCLTPVVWYFNPRSRGGSDSVRLPELACSVYFNPRSRGGSDAGIAGRIKAAFEFQSTLPRRERRKSIPVDNIILKISIHAPAEGATNWKRKMQRRKLYFNPRSRGGSDWQPLAGARPFDISIHAPAEGATFRIRISEQYNRISIHAPAEGATAGTVRNVYIIQTFQSTLPRRERQAGTDKLIYLKDFNPRSRGGSDVSPSYHLHSSQTFQSTLPRRERRSPTRKRGRTTYFNPRSRGGSDLWTGLWICVCENFNPRSRGGSDFVCVNVLYDLCISIHAPAEGATANIHNFFGVISEQNVHICIFSYIISFSRRINNHINKEINEFFGANRLGIYGCFIFARIFMKFLITAPLYDFFIKKYRTELSDV